MKSVGTSLALSEELKSQTLVDASAVLVLLGVVVKGSVVSGGTDVGGFGELVRSKGVHEEEGSELEAVLIGAEHVLVVQEVGSKEEQEALKVDNLGEYCIMNQARARNFGVICHFSLIFKL